MKQDGGHAKILFSFSLMAATIGRVQLAVGVYRLMDIRHTYIHT